MKVSVFIGRFQPFHKGHAAMLQEALKAGDYTVVVLGSAFQARSSKNPFTAKERESMIRLTLSEADNQRVLFLPVRDYYDNDKWVAAVESGVRELCRQKFSTKPQIQLIGHIKDATSYYLDIFPDWPPIRFEKYQDFDATPIRRILLGDIQPDAALAVLGDRLPEAIVEYLKAWIKLPYLFQLRKEWAAIQAYRKPYENLPYPPTFVTADAVITCQNKVLLIKRKSEMGDGLWALPGGFLEPNETLYQAALRELKEETGLQQLPQYWQHAFQAQHTFDHPQRSLRGRTVTTAFWFDLHYSILPEVRVTPEAYAVEWVPIGDLDSMENLFFEDHFHILKYFLP